MADRVLLKNHQNRLKDGRGQGRGQEYIPFIQASDNRVASEGWLTRSLGWKSQRIHHTLSRHEYHYLLVQEWADNVIDIREQYPLDFELTMKIAKKLNIQHPHLKGECVVMTSDFMLTVKTSNGEEVDFVRTVKPVNKLTKRTLELFEIERRYYLELGISWSIVLEKEKPLNLIKNIDWLYDTKNLGTRDGVDDELVEMVADPLHSLLARYGTNMSISKTCLKCDDQLGLLSGTSLYIVKYMLANKYWVTDMNQLIRENKPLQINFGTAQFSDSLEYA